MNAEETESTKTDTKTGLNVPAGALVIIPLRSRVLYPSMMMPLMARSAARRQIIEEAVRQQIPIGFGWRQIREASGASRESSAASLVSKWSAILLPWSRTELMS